MKPINYQTFNAIKKRSFNDVLFQGLRYIHGSPIRCHGNLKSRNCVIDSRWQLRITDYGLPGFFTALKQIRTDLEPYGMESYSFVFVFLFLSIQWGTPNTCNQCGMTGIFLALTYSFYGPDNSKFCIASVS